MRTIVVNHRDIQFNPQTDVNIMRPSKWGNRFRIGRDGTRAEVIEKCWGYVLDNTELLGSLCELKGKRLVCCCEPLPCHGDIYMELIEEWGLGT